MNVRKTHKKANMLETKQSEKLKQLNGKPSFSTMKSASREKTGKSSRAYDSSAETAMALDALKSCFLHAASFARRRKNANRVRER